jgi:hypothetical protein
VWEGNEGRTRKERNKYGISVGKSERKRSLGEPKSVWEGNIKVDLIEI